MCVCVFVAGGGGGGFGGGGVHVRDSPASSQPTKKKGCGSHLENPGIERNGSGRGGLFGSMRGVEGW